MAKRTKTLASNLPVPQSADEAAGAIAEIGALQRDVARIEHAMNDELARVKEGAEREARPMLDAIERMKEGLRIFCEANRERLTDGGKVKYAEFGTGRIEWRLRPPSVRMKPGVKVEDVIAWVEAQAAIYGVFVRVKKDINKEAMLADRDTASTIPGVTISTAGEDFAVTPFEAQIDGGAA